MPKLRARIRPLEYERRFGAVEDLSHLGPFVNKLDPKKGKIWDATLIDPSVYLAWFDQRINKLAQERSIEFEKEQDFVIDLKVEKDLYVSRGLQIKKNDSGQKYCSCHRGLFSSYEIPPSSTICSLGKSEGCFQEAILNFQFCELG